MAICSHSIICPACPFASRPAFAGLGAVARACAETARAAIKSIVEADPVAACVRAIMLDRTMWTGSAADLLRLCAESARDDISRGIGWARSPRALAGRLRRAHTFLRTLDIEIVVT